MHPSGWEAPELDRKFMSGVRNEDMNGDVVKRARYEAAMVDPPALKAPLSINPVARTVLGSKARIDGQCLVL